MATRGTSSMPLRCAVVGGGTMGAGIAHAMLLAGSQVSLLERNDDAAAAAGARVAKAVTVTVDRRLLDEPGPTLQRLTTTTDVALLADAELVIEAVPEELDLKVDIFRRIAAVVPPTTVIASNTSSISLDTLAGTVAEPGRVIGLHFFNPVPASQLVEIVVGRRTDPGLAANAEAWVRGWGKTPVTVRDVPGFASSRLGVTIGLEAIRMLEDGVASAADIDAAMTLGYGFPIGPLRLTDLVGLDVRLGIARYLCRELGPRFQPPRLMIDMVERGELGRKTGRGFFDWTSSS